MYLRPEREAWSRPTNNLLVIFYRLLEHAGIDRLDAQGRKLDLHALRVCLASRLARAGVGLVQVQKILGHSDPRLTASVYTTLEVEDLRSAIQTLKNCASATPLHSKAS